MDEDIALIKAALGGIDTLLTTTGPFVLNPLTLRALEVERDRLQQGLINLYVKKEG